MTKKQKVVLGLDPKTQGIGAQVSRFRFGGRLAAARCADAQHDAGDQRRDGGGFGDADDVLLVGGDVDRAEIDLPPGTDPYSAAVYARAQQNLVRLQESGVLVRERRTTHVSRVGPSSVSIPGGGACRFQKVYRLRR